MGSPRRVTAVTLAVVAALVGLAKAGIDETCATVNADKSFNARVASTDTVCAVGASLPYSLYLLTTFAYSPYGTVTYKSTGSTTGKDSAEHLTVDFAGSDSLLKDSQYANAPDLQMYPSTAAPVVPVYNIPELGNLTLALDRDVLPKIFLGDITQWGDPEILAAQDDSRVRDILQNEIPTKQIKVVVRDDGSGTTEIFTKALALFAPADDTNLTFGSRIEPDDVIDWCEDGREDLLCPTNASNPTTFVEFDGTDATQPYFDPVTGECYNNPAKFGCFGSKGECEGYTIGAWDFNSGFKTSGNVTCFKDVHGYEWSYIRGYKTSGVVAAVFQETGTIGYSVLSDAITNGLRLAKMKNKAGTYVSADDGESVSFALMELGGAIDDNGNADLQDAASTKAWPIAGYTYYVLRKGIENSINYMTAAPVMFGCGIREKTMAYLEWYYTSDTPVAIGNQLGFTMLPDFIAEGILTDMLGENYCDPDSPQLAKSPNLVEYKYFFVTDMSSYVLDTYVNVYKEVDPLVEWTYNVVPEDDLSSTYLSQSGSSSYSSSDISAGLGIAALRYDDRSSYPTDIVAAPLYIVGVAPIYHYSVDPDLVLDLTLQQIADILTGSIKDFAAIGGNSSDFEEFKLVLRSDSCDSTEILTDTLQRSLCTASDAYTTVPICQCIGSGTVRQLDSAFFDGSRTGCGAASDFSDRIILVESDSQVASGVVFHKKSVGIWASVGSLGSASVGRVNSVELSTTSLENCMDDMSQYTLTSSTGEVSRVYDTSYSTTSNCYPVSRSYALVIREILIGSNQCETDDYYAGVGESDAVKFAKWLYSSNTTDSVMAAITNLGLAPPTSSDRTTVESLVDFDCNPDFDKCSAGTYFSNDDCIACPEGSIAATSGLSACTKCPAGTREKDRIFCLSCDTDEYQPDEGQTKCNKCVEHSLYLEASGDEDFPFIPKQGAENKTQCACTEGYYTPEDEDSGEICVECPIGGLCLGTGDSARIEPVPAPGWYARKNKPEVMLLCLTPFACPGGDVEVCGTGYEGDLCSECSPGYFMRTGVCNVCEPGHDVASFVAVFMFLLIAIAVHFIANIDRSGSLMRSTTAAAAEVQSTILFLQIFNLFLVVRVDWPDAIRQLMQWFSWINIDLSVLSLECTYPIAFSFGWRLKVLFPYFFAMFYIAYTIGFWVYFVAYKYRHDLFQARKECVSFVYKSINASFLITSMLYISTTKTIFEAFACTRQPDGTTTMPLYPALECSSETFINEIMPTAYLTLITIAIGYPACLSIIFMTGYDTMSEAVFISTQIVRAPYKKKYYFWEVVDLLRKFILAMTLNFAAALSTGAQLAILSLIMIIALVLQVSYRPFKHLNVNTLVVYIFSVLLFVLITAGMIFNETGAQESSIITALTVMTYFVVITAVLFSFINVVLSIAMFYKAQRTGEIVQHQVLVTEELLDATVDQLRGVSSAKVIEQCKEIIDDEDMQRAFNDAICLLFVLSTTSKGLQYSSGSLRRMSTGQSLSEGSNGSGSSRKIQRGSSHSSDSKERRKATKDGSQRSLPFTNMRDESSGSVKREESMDQPLDPKANKGIQDIEATKLLDKFGSVKRMNQASKLSKQVKDVDNEEAGDGQQGGKPELRV